jgi:putative transposase
MDERHLLAAARYVERNPVRAKLCPTPRNWPWSSVRAHLAGQDDSLVTVRPLLELIPDWDAYVAEPDAAKLGDLVQAHAGTGRPLGPDSFVENLERRLGRPLKRRKPGPKPQERDLSTLDLFEDRTGK